MTWFDVIKEDFIGQGGFRRVQMTLTKRNIDSGYEFVIRNWPNRKNSTSLRPEKVHYLQDKEAVLRKFEDLLGEVP